MTLATTNTRSVNWLTNGDTYDYPLTVGAELVANGNFTSGAASWTLGVGWTLNGAEMRATGPITDIDLSQSVAVVVGDYYFVEFDIQNVSLTTWSCQLSMAGYTYSWISGAPSQCEGARHYRFVFQALNVGGSLYGEALNFRATVQGAAYFAIDNVTVKHVTSDQSFISQMIEGEITPRKDSFDGYGYTVSDWSVSIG